MKQFRIIVDDARAWAPYAPSEQVITASDYLQHTEATTKPGYIINMCSGLEYLGTGYYCSLLAEARGEKVIPSVGTINDLHNFDHYRLFDADLERTVESEHGSLWRQTKAGFERVEDFGSGSYVAHVVDEFAASEDC